MRLFLLLILFLNTALAGFPPTTLKGQGQSSSTTTFNFQVPAKQATKTSTGTLIETGNQNILSNSDFEHSTVSTDITTSGSGIALSAETTNVISGLQSLKMALTSSTNAEVILESSTNSQWSGVQATASCKIKTSLSGIKFCSISGGVEENCLDVSSANTWQDYIIPTVASSSSTNGLKVKVGSGTLTGDVYVDGCKYESARIGTLLACPDPVKCAVRYEAELNGTSGTITKEPIDWLTSVVRNSAGNYTVNFNSGIFTQTPFCAVTNTDGGNYSVDNNGTISTTQWGFRTFNASTGATIDNARVTIQCFKSGTDYTNALALTSSISASNQDYDWTAYGTTSDFTGFGTPTSIALYHKRIGSDLLIRGNFTCGTTTATEARLNLPNSLTSTSTISTVELAGFATSSNTGGDTVPLILIEPSKGYMTFGFKTSGQGGLTKVNGSSFCASGNTISFNAKFSINGWNTPNQVIATVKDNVQMSVPNGKPKTTLASIDCASSSSITKQFSSDFTAVSNISSGFCNATIRTGLFSSTPICTGSWNGSGNAYGNTTINASSATNVQITGYQSAGSPSSGYGVNIICVGY